MTTLDDLAAQLARLTDREAIRDRVYAVAHAVDYGLEDQFVDSFTPDGQFQVLLRGSDIATHVYDGHAGLRARIENHTRPPELYHKHVFVNPVIAIDGDLATCDTYFFVVSEYQSEPVILAFGRDRDQRIRCADGVWRITVRRTEMEAKGSAPVWTVRSSAPGSSGVAPAEGH
jgi:hypothetical protein